MPDAAITRLLEAHDKGDAQASAALLPAVYDELRRLAQARLASERPGQTLQATALVHEAYLRILGPDADDPGAWAGRGHFFAAAAESMRRILIDRARAKATSKRGGKRARLDLTPEMLTLDEPPAELLDLDDALTRLAQTDPQKAELVKLRFFGGLSIRQAAGVLGISQATADRHWAFARAWLYRELSGEPDA
ncbi:MAG: sigma-70 family RNA polymerase sigma factor [Phycisphaeraceae bacterium]|nr:sigma-70 family RNA polymerase sigma factor [Phycisphaeraceae bacterium]